MTTQRYTMPALISAAFQEHAQQTLYEDAHDQLTFAELGELCAGGVELLTEQGIRPGHRVALMMSDGADYFAALLSVWLCGAVPVPVNRSQASETVQLMLGHCESHMTLVDASATQTTTDGAVAWRRRRSQKLVTATVDADDDAMILYTSGTTGVPKGVRHGQHALALNAIEMSAFLKLGPSERLFLNIPFYYSNSISHLLMALFRGATLCAVHGFLLGDAMITALRQTRATGFAGVPAHYVRLADLAEGEIDCELRFLMNSGDHLPVYVQRVLMDSFPRAEMYCVYGISECAPRVCCLDPALLRAKMGSVGHPLPATEVTIRDENGEQVPSGDLGEGYVRSACLMKEYFRNPEATAKSMGEHGFRTGDIGYVDEDGCLFLSGRLDSVFKSGGEKVSCRLIEETIRDSGHVSDALTDVVVTESPDHYLGKVARVYYVPRSDDGTALQAVKRELKSMLPKSHIPREYVAIREIQRSPSGKVVKQSLSDPDNVLPKPTESS